MYILWKAIWASGCEHIPSANYNYIWLRPFCNAADQYYLFRGNVVHTMWPILQQYSPTALVSILVHIYVKWFWIKPGPCSSLLWRHNESDRLSNQRSIYCLLNADQRKHQSSASQAFVRGIHQWPMNSPHKGPVTWRTFLFDDIMMIIGSWRPPDHKSLPMSVISIQSLHKNIMLCSSWYLARYSMYIIAFKLCRSVREYCIHHSAGRYAIETHLFID